jgi:hypothetical protein
MERPMTLSAAVSRVGCAHQSCSLGGGGQSRPYDCSQPLRPFPFVRRKIVLANRSAAFSIPSPRHAPYGCGGVAGGGGGGMGRKRRSRPRPRISWPRSSCRSITPCTAAPASCLPRFSRAWPSSRMFLRSLKEAQYNVGTGSRTFRQNLIPLGSNEHAVHGIGLHHYWNEYVEAMAGAQGRKELLTLQTRYGNGGRLAENLASGAIQPSEIGKMLDDFYAMNYSNPKYREEVARMVERLKAINPDWK